MRTHWTRAVVLSLVAALVGSLAAWPLYAGAAGPRRGAPPRTKTHRRAHPHTKTHRRAHPHTKTHGRGHPHTKPHRRIGPGGAPRRGRLVWDDEFSGRAGASPKSTRWQVIYGGNGFGNRELQYYTRRSSNIADDGRGHLMITGLRGLYRGRDGVTRSYTSGAIQTKGRFNALYGRLEARIEIPQGKGLWPAFWAVGGNVNRVGWPGSGEIDMMENVGNPFTIYGSIHGPQRGRPNGYGISASKRTSRSLAGGFHVYGVTWSPNTLVFTLDGHPYATDTRATLGGGQRWVFNHPFFLIVNLAIGGNWPGTPDASTSFPARMLVDWVRVYTLR